MGISHQPGRQVNEASKGLAPKTVGERVDKLRKDAAALGLRRKEVYAHDEDWPAIKTLAEKLHRRRNKLVARRAP